MCLNLHWFKLPRLMKQLLLIVSFLIASLGYSQSTGSISGMLLDQESSNEPLLYAKVTVKGTNIEAQSNEDGLFVIENLKSGSYTLVCSFVGYDSKEILVDVLPNKNLKVNAALTASTISLEDLIFASAKADNKTAAALN